MKRQLVKWLLYVVFGVMVYTLQTALGGKVMLFGIRPNLVPFLICAVAVFEGEKCGSWYAFFIGIICDTFHPISIGFFSIVYFALAYGVGIVTKKYLTVGFLTTLLLGVLVSVFTNILLYVVFYMIFESVHVLDMLYITWIEAVYSLSLSFIVYLPISFIGNRFDR